MARWISSPFRRALDIILSACGIVGLSPIMLLAAAAILLTDGSPVIFTQTRVGRQGKRFGLLKFRSMRSSSYGAQITLAEDKRITKVGRFLRRYKIDELPQLWNVLRGDMALVGPRPEVPAYVDRGSTAWQEMLLAAPGITDPASLAFRDEGELLSGRDDWDSYYREVILPCKLDLSLAYLRSATFLSDMLLIGNTIRYGLLRRGHSGRVVDNNRAVARK